MPKLKKGVVGRSNATSDGFVFKGVPIYGRNDAHTPIGHFQEERMYDIITKYREEKDLLKKEAVSLGVSNIHILSPRIGKVKTDLVFGLISEGILELDIRDLVKLLNEVDMTLEEFNIVRFMG